MTIRRVVFIIKILVILGCLCRSASAYKQPTHQHAAQLAVEYFNQLAESVWDVNQFKASDLGQLGEYSERMVEGAYDEDRLGRWFDHFYNPVNGRGLSELTSMTARQQAKIYWTEEVLPAYKRGEASDAWYYLGRIAHLVQDMTVPAHVLLDPHPSFDNLETYMDEIYAYPPVDIISHIAHYADIDELMLGTAMFAVRFASDDYDGDSLSGTRILRDGEQGSAVRWGALSKGRCYDFGATLFPRAMEATASLILMFVQEVRPRADISREALSLGETQVRVWPQTCGSRLEDGHYVGGIGAAEVEYRFSLDGESWSDTKQAAAGQPAGSWEFTIPAENTEYCCVRILDKGGLYSEWVEVLRIRPAHWEEVIVNQETNHNQMLVDAAMSMDDKTLTVWLDRVESEDSRDFDQIKLGELAADGTPTGNEVVVHSLEGLSEDEEGALGRALIASNGDGLTVVVWTETVSGSAGEYTAFRNSLYYRLYQASLSPVGEKREVASSWVSADPDGESGTTYQTPGVAINDQGAFVLVWAETLGSTTTRIMARRYDWQAGEVAGFEEALSSNIFVRVETPCTAVDDEGNFSVAWQQRNTSSGAQAIFVRRYQDPYYALDGTAMRIDDGHGKASQPDLAYLVNGDIVITWKNTLPFSFDNPVFASEIRARLLHKDNQISPSFPASTTPDMLLALPAVAASPKGGFALVWSTLELDAIWGRSFAEDGSAWDEQDIRLSRTSHDLLLGPKVEFDSAGGAVVVWEGAGKNSEDGLDIYSRRFIAAPCAPTQLSVKAGSSAKAVTVTWDEVAGASFYVLERATAPRGPWISVYTGEDHEFIDYAVYEGPGYYYRVRAYNRFGESAWSCTTVPYSLTSGADPPGPPVPPVEAVDNLNGSYAPVIDASTDVTYRFYVTLNWEDANILGARYRATDYLLEYGTDSHPAQHRMIVPFSQTILVSYALSVANLPGQQYIFKVSPHNNAGSGSPRTCTFTCPGGP